MKEYHNIWKKDGQKVDGKGLLIRFRMGNEVKSRKYWEEEEQKRRKLFESEKESWEHV